VLLLGDILRRHARYRPDKVAYVVENEQVTYRQFDARANRLANVLAAHGVDRGARVAILAHNGIDYPVAYFAAARLGAILVPINARLQAAEARYVLAQSESGTLLYGPEFGALVAACARDLPHLRHRFALDDAGDGTPTLEPLLERAADRPPEAAVHEDDPHVMLYTSGTTGDPKGALCSHRSYYLQAGQTQATNGLGEDDVGVSMFPMFHMGGWALPLGFWYNGGTVVIARRAEPDALLGAIARERATYFYGVPTIYARMLELPNLGRYDVTSLRAIAGGTAAMSEDLIRSITERFSTASLSILYGSTEAGPISHLRRRDLFRKPTSVGRPVLNVDVRVVRPDGGECAAGETGEVTVRSELRMRGYWRLPEATAETIRDGWVWTGDLAAFDEQGFLHIAGRIKDVIKSGGENVYPAEIERALQEHPKIREVAVVGVPDPEWTEAPLAAIVLQPGTTMTEAEVFEHLRERIAGFKKPRHVRFVESLPRTASTQQVQKPLLREMLFTGGTARGARSR
jgi:acyl-CoA synthetase (AMP-forming)/AMP-acid ligase II